MLFLGVVGLLKFYPLSGRQFKNDNSARQTRFLPFQFRSVEKGNKLVNNFAAHAAYISADTTVQ
jgi:hypothetical protein